MTDMPTLIGDAQRKGFSVMLNDDGSGWLISVPARPRVPCHVQGEFKTPERAWACACLIAQDYNPP